MTMHRASICAFGSMALLLAGCGGGGGKPASQVAVKVNKDEISVHQVNEQLVKLAPNLPAERRDEAVKSIVSGLIDQNLLVQQAMERKLDRDPEVLAAIEQSRRQILAQAFVQKVLTAQAKPSEQDVKKYYADNPSLFSDRRVYRLNELSFQASDAQLAELSARIEKTKKMDDVVTWLRDNKIDFAASSNTRGAEQLPMATVSRIAAMKENDLMILKGPAGRSSAVKVIASVPSPVEEKAAAPLIEQFLANRKREELARLEVGRLRGEAQLEYVGDFAKYAGAAAAGPAKPLAVASESPAPIAVPTTAATTAPTSVMADPSKASAVTATGVAGLR